MPLKIWQVLYGFVLLNRFAAKRAGLFGDVEMPLQRVIDKLGAMACGAGGGEFKLAAEVPEGFSDAVAEYVAKVAVVLAGKGFIPLDAPPAVGVAVAVVLRIQDAAESFPDDDPRLSLRVVRMAAYAIAILCDKVVAEKRQVIEDIDPLSPLDPEKGFRMVHEAAAVYDAIQAMRPARQE